MQALIAEAFTPAAAAPFFTAQQTAEQSDITSMLQTTFVSNKNLSGLPMTSTTVPVGATTVGTWAQNMINAMKTNPQGFLGVGEAGVIHFTNDFDSAMSVVVTKINGNMQTYSPGAPTIGQAPYSGLGGFNYGNLTTLLTDGQAASTNLTAITNRNATALNALLSQAQAALTFGHSTLTVITQLSNTVASFQ